MPMNVSSSGPSNKANIFLGLIEYELNSLHLVDYISVHIQFDLERYLLIIFLLTGLSIYMDEYRAQSPALWGSQALFLPV